jgi:hypothetical protein
MASRLISPPLEKRTGSHDGITRLQLRWNFQLGRKLRRLAGVFSGPRSWHHAVIAPWDLPPDGSIIHGEPGLRREDSGTLIKGANNKPKSADPGPAPAVELAWGRIPARPCTPLKRLPGKAEAPIRRDSLKFVCPCRVANAGESAWSCKHLPNGKAREAHGYTRAIHTNVTPLKAVVIDGNLKSLKT